MYGGVFVGERGWVVFRLWVCVCWGGLRALFWGFCGVICGWVLFVYRHKRRFEPLPLSVRYAFECNFLILGVGNQPVWIVFGWWVASAGCFAVFWYMW